VLPLEEEVAVGEGALHLRAGEGGRVTILLRGCDAGQDQTFSRRGHFKNGDDGVFPD
jgi:hypothetical protein